MNWKQDPIDFLVFTIVLYGVNALVFVLLCEHDVHLNYEFLYIRINYSNTLHHITVHNQGNIWRGTLNIKGQFVIHLMWTHQMLSAPYTAMRCVCTL